MSNPKCFISYSWDNDNHKDWVRYLAERLQYAGVATFLDQWDLKLGMNILQWIEDSISSSDYMLLICTPKFVERANNMKGGVGQEKVIIGGEMYYKLRPQTGFIPIIRFGSTQDALPRYLGAAKWIDFREDDIFDLALEELLRHIYDSPKFCRPAIGKPPEFISSNDAKSKIHNNKMMHPNNIDNVYELSAIANKWEGNYRAYYIVEELSKELSAIVRHPPSNMTNVDEPLRSFLLLSGLHYGGNWIHWLRINLKNEDVISLLFAALSTSYDRVMFRSLYSMQLVDDNDLNEYLNANITKVNEYQKELIETIVLPKKVMDYLKDVAKSDDKKLAEKAQVVIREIERFK